MYSINNKTKESNYEKITTNTVFRQYIDFRPGRMAGRANCLNN